MPKQSNSKQSQQESDERVINRVPFGKDVQWVSANLSGNDKKWLADNRNDSLAYVAEFLAKVDPSFSLSIKFDDKARRYNVVLLCTDKDHPAASCALSLRARTPFDAIYAMAYWTEVRDLEPWWAAISDDDDDPYN